MASVNTQFSIAVHLLAGLGLEPEARKTSASLARSVNTSPSFVRRVLAKLSRAGLVTATTGKSGACLLARRPREISLLEVYEAVQAPKVFAVHRYPVRKDCTVSCTIQTEMEKVLAKAQSSLESTLRDVSLAQVIAGIKNA